MVEMTSSEDSNHVLKNPHPKQNFPSPEGYFLPKPYLKNPAHYKQKTYFSLPNHQLRKNCFFFVLYKEQKG